MRSFDTNVPHFQNLTGIEKIVIKSKRNLAGTAKEVMLWELLHPWEEETEDLWQMGQFMMRAYDNEDFKLNFIVHKANSSEGYVALDDVVILMKEVCDSLPAYAEPVPASSENLELIINLFSMLNFASMPLFQDTRAHFKKISAAGNY